VTHAEISARAAHDWQGMTLAELTGFIESANAVGVNPESVPIVDADEVPIDPDDGTYTHTVLMGIHVSGEVGAR
jgi:hypothetical protein